MILPFVRELLADLESSASFERVRRHLAGGTGRRRVSGLTATARALYLPSFVRAAQSSAPAVVLVADNKAADTLYANLLAAAELTGALAAEFLALGLDPYPRKPDAIFKPVIEAADPEDHPFAALKALQPSAKPRAPNKPKNR